ncbi:MAG: 50S ribosomal protein L15e [Candidatus Micrarchaeaceae archaeon]
MGTADYIRESFIQEYKERSKELRLRIAGWRKEPPVKRIEKPTNIARARRLGYRDKQGVVVIRVRVRKGLSKRRKIRVGRKPSKMGRFYAYRKSSQAIAEERANRKYSNCEVLNSYYVGEDGEYKFYEVILLDRAHPSIAKDPIFSKIIRQRGRAFRGLTSAHRKNRGLMKKGFGAEKNRPSVRSKQRNILRI